MKRFTLLACMLVLALAAHAQFEKGKWIVNPSLTGLSLSHDTEISQTSFGLGGNVGNFILDNVALMIHAGADWQTGPDLYSIGVGGRYYFDQIGVFGGANLNYDYLDSGRVSFGVEAGYAFFLSRTVTLEPAVYWNIHKGGSKIGLQVGFGFYF